MWVLSTPFAVKLITKQIRNSIENQLSHFDLPYYIRELEHFFVSTTLCGTTVVLTDQKRTAHFLRGLQFLVYLIL